MRLGAMTETLATPPLPPQAPAPQSDNPPPGTASRADLRTTGKWLAAGVALGAATGAALGSVALGTAFGVGLGATFGVARARKGRAAQS